MGLKEEVLAVCAFHAIADTPSLFNARPVGDPQEVLNLYLEVY
jgi:aldehyde dehydrogenase (NAD+)